jgi:cytochrome c biogenesis protein CcmG/thiol:disulfide interchange protein DsbE
MTKKSLYFLIPLALFLVLLGFLGAGLKLDPREVPSPLIGKPAPGFALARLDDPATTTRCSSNSPSRRCCRSTA